MYKKLMIQVGLFITLYFLALGAAQADFRKALEALQNRDGTAMLTQVRNAANEQNNDGLILFMNALQIDEQSSKKKSLKESNQTENDRSKMDSTFESILSKSQQQEIKSLLTSAVQNSRAEVRYQIFYRYPKFVNELPKRNRLDALEKLAEEGSYGAAEELVGNYSDAYNTQLYSKEKAEYWFAKAAELGNAEYALLLAAKYLNYKYYLPGSSFSSKECSASSRQIFCFERNEVKGLYWLKQAIKHSDENHFVRRKISYQVAEILRKGNLTPTPAARQIYLWYSLGLNSPDPNQGFGLNPTYFFNALNEMYNSKELNLAAPELDAIWMNEKQRNAKLYFKEFTELPALLLVARQRNSEQKPLFSFEYMEFMYYKLDVFPDGKVFLQTNGPTSVANRDQYIQVSPETIKRFVNKLNDFGFHDWLLVNSQKSENTYRCSNGYSDCPGVDSLITLNQGNQERTVHFGYSKDRLDKDINPQIAKRIALIFSLVEEYFPTQKLRCTLGNSEAYKQACIQHDNQMIDLAK